MKKHLSAALILFFVLGTVYAQNAGSPVSRMDAMIKGIAGDINRKLSSERAVKIAIGQFTLQNSISSLSSYWSSHLTEELTNIPDRSFIVLSGGPAGADWTVSGEIIEVAGIIRIYTRIIRSSDRSIAASFHSDFELDEYLDGMLSSGNSGTGRSSYTPMDSWEPDSWDDPVPVTITTVDAVTETIPSISRSFHNNDDKDFFILLPDRDGCLTMETTGSLDTLMELYDADTRESLASDDDSGSSYNARINYNVQAGKRYIVKLEEYDGGTGYYSFRAYFCNRTNDGD